MAGTGATQAEDMSADARVGIEASRVVSGKLSRRAAALLIAALSASLWLGIWRLATTLFG